MSNDQAGALLAREIEADIHVTTTARPARSAGFATPDQKAKLKANPDLLLAEEEDEFAGWTLPKVMAAFGIARSTGNPL
jgi:carbamate kinase